MSLSSVISGLQHLGLPTRHLEETVAWYTEVLGFEVIHRKTLTELHGEVPVAFMKKGDCVIETYQVAGPDKLEHATRRHGLWDHVAFNVTDIHDAYADAEARSLHILDAGIRQLPFWENGVAFFTVLGPNGEKVEFNQYL